MNTQTTISNTCQPANVSEVSEIIQQVGPTKTPIYPSGGRTCLHYGLPARQPGWDLSLENMRQIVDYPARDLTVTVEAGTNLAELNRLLAGEGQQLPWDVPQAEQATIGGIVATNFNGPRRLGYGAIRDYVIGIEAVDGSGLIFHGGGRVVKNVAGYDFCKFLTGSAGTLAVLTQLTLKVAPLRPHRQLVLARLPDDWNGTESVLAALASSEVTPVALELLVGSGWQAEKISSPSLAILLEGTEPEVTWMVERLQQELPAVGCCDLTTEDCSSLWQRIVEFPAEMSAALMLQARLVPSGVVPFIEQVLKKTPEAQILAHAGHGTVFVQWNEAPLQGFAALLNGELIPLAKRYHGGTTVLWADNQLERTRQLYWGGRDFSGTIPLGVKQKFDPHDLLNRGRFFFPAAG